MWQYVAKVSISAVVVVAIAEIAKRSSFWSAALASLPLTSLLAMIWLYIETDDTAKVVSLSQGIFWLVLPSLVLFLVLPLLLREGWSFWFSLAAASVATACAYVVMVWVLTKTGIRL